MQTKYRVRKLIMIIRLKSHIRNKLDSNYEIKKQRLIDLVITIVGVENLYEEILLEKLENQNDILKKA